MKASTVVFIGSIFWAMIFAFDTWRWATGQPVAASSLVMTDACVVTLLLLVAFRDLSGEKS